MKNKLFKYFLLFFFLLKANTYLFANEFSFDSKEINISGDGSIIIASEGTATSLEDNNKIKAKSFQYNNKTFTLIAKDALTKLNNDTIQITSGQLLYNKDRSLITISENVEIKDLLNDITIKSEKFIYDTIHQIFISNSTTEITDKFVSKYFAILKTLNEQDSNNFQRNLLQRISEDDFYMSKFTSHISNSDSINCQTDLHFFFVKEMFG